METCCRKEGGSDSPHTLRYHLTLQTLGNAWAEGYETILADGSDDAAKVAFDRLGAMMHPRKEPGAGPCLRQLCAIPSMATEDILFWMEPEQPDFIRLIPGMAVALEERELDILIPHAHEKRVNEENRNQTLFYGWKGAVMFRGGVRWTVAERDPQGGLDISYGASIRRALLKTNPRSIRIGRKKVQFYEPAQLR